MTWTRTRADSDTDSVSDSDGASASARPGPGRAGPGVTVPIRSRLGCRCRGGPGEQMTLPRGEEWRGEGNARGPGARRPHQACGSELHWQQGTARQCTVTEPEVRAATGRMDVSTVTVGSNHRSCPGPRPDCVLCSVTCARLGRAHGRRYVLLMATGRCYACQPTRRKSNLIMLFERKCGEEMKS